MHHMTDYQLLEIVVIFIVSGLFAGASGSFFGVGGGTVLVPTLLAVYTWLDSNHTMDMHQAVGSSLALVIFNSIMATRKHHASGNLPKDYLKSWMLWLFVGTLIGGVLLAYVSSYFLKIIFTAYLFAACLYQLLRKDKQGTGGQLPRGIVEALGGIIIGALSLILGLAGGTFSTPFFTYFHYPIKKAMAISMVGGMVIGGVGTIAAIIIGWGLPGRLMWSIGYVNFITVIVVAPFVMISSPWGVKLAAHLSERTLKWLYSLFLLLIACFMVYHLVGR